MWKKFFMFRATTHKSTLMTWHAISLWYFDVKNLWYVALTCNFTPPSLLSDYKDHFEHTHVACLLRMTEVAVTSFIHSIVLCVCVRADCGHDNDEDECFHFALDCFGRWETPVDGDTWYFYWFFISCAVIILNCVNQWMQWVHCAVINHKIWNVLWNTSLFLYCSEWNVTREVNNVEWSEWH